MRPSSLPNPSSAARSACLLASAAVACGGPTEPEPRPPREPEETGTTAPTTPAEDGCEGLPMFLLAGQSNMEGNVDSALFASLLDELAQGSDDDLRDRLLAALQYWYFEVDDGYASYGYTSEMADLEIEALIAYRDAGLLGPDLTAPHADTYCAFDEPAAPLTGGCGYPFGPELMAGHAWAVAGGAPTSFIKVAKGGSTLYTDWRSPTSGGVVGSEYQRLSRTITSLASDPAAVHPACADEACQWGAFVWFQGENDSFDEQPASEYESNLRNLLADVRAAAGDPELPVIVVQTGAWAQSLDYGRVVAAAQQRVVDEDPLAQLIVTDDLSGYYHYDPAAQLIIGARVLEAIQTLVDCADTAGSR
jgi:hypothetical protein